MKHDCLLLVFLLLYSSSLFLIKDGQVLAQCSSPYIKIDNNLVLADNSNSGIKLPYWLKEGQTLAADQNVNAISVIQFTANSGTLTFSQVVSVTTSSSVPSGTVWKIESISKKSASNLSLSAGNTNSVTFGYGAGGSNYNWTAPSCVYYICVDLWGAGGGGGGGYGGATSGGGGGGGAYARVCSAVTPGTSYTLNVGAGGTGGLSAAGSAGASSSITIGATTYTAGGGNGGGYVTSGFGAGGSGGTTSNVTTYQNGQTGYTAVRSDIAGRGGDGGNGGSPGNSTFYHGGEGSIPGGGGGGGAYSAGYVGGRGADGRIIISW